MATEMWAQKVTVVKEWLLVTLLVFHIVNGLPEFKNATQSGKASDGLFIAAVINLDASGWRCVCTYSS